MRKILIPVDGGAAAESAVRAVVAQAEREPIGAIHLLNVQPRVHACLGRLLPRETLRSVQAEEGQKALAGARRILDGAGLDYQAHLRIGRNAETVAATAAALGVDQIVLAAEGGGLFAGLRRARLAKAVRRHGNVPVVVVRAGPKAERDPPFGRGRSPAPR